MNSALVLMEEADDVTLNRAMPSVRVKAIGEVELPFDIPYISRI
jgi:hypothetical protein